MTGAMFRAWMVLGCLAALGYSAAAYGKDAPDPTRPKACSLSSAAFSERTTGVGALLARHEVVRELDDGYAFRFPGNDTDLAEQLATLIIAERQCCSFLGFELTFAPEQGPVWVAVTGSKEVKALIASLMTKPIDSPSGEPKR